MNLEKHITKPFAIVLDKKGGIKKDINEKDLKSWINLDYRNEKTKKILEEEYNLDTYAINILTSDNTHQRITVLEDNSGTIIILKKAAGKNRKKPSSLRILLKENQIITLCHNQSLAIEKTLEKLEKNKGSKDSTECFIDIIQSIFSSTYEKILKITNELDKIEEAIIKNKTKKNLNHSISSVRKKIIETHRYLIPQRDIFDGITEEVSFIKKSKYKNQFKEINNNIIKTIDSISFSREHILILQEELKNDVSISMNNQMYIISIIIALFTPITVVSSIFGMNVGGIPYGNNQYGFMIMIGIMFIICLISYLLIRQIKKN